MNGRGMPITHTKWTPQMDNTLKDIWDKKSRPQTAAVLGITEAALYRRAKYLRLPLKDERASHGGALGTDTTRDIAATKRFEERYKEAAKRNHWIIREYL